MSSIQVPQLGIAEIDAQHGKLVACVERLELWESRGQGFAALLDALNALSDYAQVHFTYEEDFLRRQNYPHLEPHMAEHREFTAQLARLTEQVLAGDRTSEHLIAFVRNWVTTHIGAEDVAFAHYFTSLRRF